MASLIISEIRSDILSKLGYTCSAGISINKTLAKLWSSQFKPNKQSILRDKDVMNYMETLPLQKIRNLGGKLGTNIEQELGVETAGQLWCDFCFFYIPLIHIGVYRLKRSGRNLVK